MNNCVEIKGLTKKFGKFTAVNNVSFSLETGKVYGLIGPNGAGKSTLMSMIMGLLFPTEGTGNVKGHELGSRAALQILGYSPEFTSFYSDMSALEYLWYMGTLSGLSDQQAKERSLELIEQFELKDDMNKKVSKFSTGMKKKISLAQAMIHNPEILLLDEPTANLDPTARFEILETIRKLVKSQQMTVLISSHVLTELQTIITDVIMLEKGKLILATSIEEAQKMFNKGILMVDTDNNAQLFENLKDRYSVEITDGILKFSADGLNEIRKDIVKEVYENGWMLNSMSEEKITLESLYKQVMEGDGNNDSGI
ncbi:MAG: ABC transporter ATP-binding protein [Erysipelotrichaceae bacterium]|nr:ABC transporter ATP-binding protein [Erysipelotrichaceae bacterium]